MDNNKVQDILWGSLFKYVKMKIVWTHKIRADLKKLIDLDRHSLVIPVDTTFI